MPIRENFRQGYFNEYVYFPDGTAASSTVGQPLSSFNRIGNSKEIDNLNNESTFQKGLFKVNPVVISEVVCVSMPTSFDKILSSNWCWNGRYVLNGDIAMYFGEVPGKRTPDASLVDLSIVKAYSKLNQASVDVGVILGELTETLHMLRHPLESLVAFARRRRDLDKAFDYRKRNFALGDAFAGTWMEFRYGLLPLMADIDAIRNEFSSKAVASTVTLRRKRGQKERPVDKSVDGTGGTGWGPLGFDVTRETTRSTKVVTTLYYNIKLDFPWLDLLRRYGLSPLQFESLVWELTGMSFVIDWFIDVGNWLGAITPNPNIEHVGGCVSAVMQDTVRTFISNGSSCQGYEDTPQQVSGEYVATRKTLIRTVNPQIPSYPPIKWDMTNYKHVVDSLAMIWQKLPKKWRRYHAS